VPASIVRAGAITCALYAVPVLAIVLVVPADRLTGLTGFIDALATVFTVYGPWAGPVALAAALAFLWILVANGLTWVMASARTQAAASLDGIGPVSLGRVSARTGTPLAATLAVGVVATLTTLAAFAVAGDDNGRYFSAALTLSIALLALAAALWPGLGTGNPDAHLPDGFAGDRLGFILAELVPLAAVLAAPSLLARRTGQAPSDAAQAPPGLGR
jgi:amino acid transporter